MQIRYLLDTNICIYIAKHNPPAVRARFTQHLASELAMSIITYGELRHGAEKSQSRAKALKAVDHLSSVITIAGLDMSVGEHYGQIRGELEQQGQIIGNNDLWLAAYARSQNWILVTNNGREFQRVNRLKVENWV